MSAPKSRVGRGLERLYKYTESKHNKFLKKHAEMKDMIENREYLGADKYGNQYFQYFNYHGLPTRRRVYYKFYSGNKFHVDVHFIDWLYRRTALPPSRSELEQLYIEDEERTAKALEWDQTEERKQIKYRNQMEAQKQLGMSTEELQLETLERQNSEDLVSLEEFKPVPWEVVQKTRPELRQYLPSEEYKQSLLAAEEGVIEEEKDYQEYIKSKGKDFDDISFVKTFTKVHEIRHHYEELQKYGYIRDGVSDPNEKISVSKYLAIKFRGSKAKISNLC